MRKIRIVGTCIGETSGYIFYVQEKPLMRETDGYCISRQQTYNYLEQLIIGIRFLIYSMVLKLLSYI